MNMNITAAQIEQRTGLTAVVLNYGNDAAPYITATGDQAIIARVNAWFAKQWLEEDTDMPTAAELADEESEASLIHAAYQTFKDGTATNAQAQRAIAWLIKQEAIRRGLL